MALSAQAAARKDKLNTHSEMQHRHFATIAAIIANMGGERSEGQYFSEIRREAAIHFADELACTNPRFDRKRFLAACNV